MSIKVTKPRISTLKLKDWLVIESTCTNEKQTSDERNRSGCVDVWIWVVGRSGSIPPPVAPDRQLVSPPSLPCQSAFSQYQPEPYNGRCSSLPLAIPPCLQFHSDHTGWDNLSAKWRSIEKIRTQQDISKKRLIELVKVGSHWSYSHYVTAK